MDLALNNLEGLICHKTKQTNQPPKQGKMFLVVQWIHEYLFTVKFFWAVDMLVHYYKLLETVAEGCPVF